MRYRVEFLVLTKETEFRAHEVVHATSMSDAKTLARKLLSVRLEHRKVGRCRLEWYCTTGLSEYEL